MTLALAAALVVASTAAAPVAPVAPAAPVADAPAFRLAVSLRAVASTGGTTYRLLDFLGTADVSRLGYHGLDGFGAELQVRLAHRDGAFATADLGLEGLVGGALRDEDFPPFIDRYSRTDSAQGGGSASLLVLAAGWDVRRSPRLRIGPVVGWFRTSETLHALGCRQEAGHPQVCVPTIPTGVRVITSEATWRAPLVGLDGEALLRPGLALAARLAVLPLLSVEGADTHWLRTGPDPATADFSGPTPIDGANGVGGLAEASLTWDVSAGLRLGAGGRLWHLDVPGALMHFERSAYPRPGATPGAQRLGLTSWRAALRLEAGWTF